MTVLGNRVERLCDLLADSELWQFAKDAGANETLSHIVSIVRGEVPGAAGPELLTALDAFDDAMAKAGAGMLTQTDRTFRPLPGPGELYFRHCPAAQPCGRVTAKDTVDAMCSLTGKPLLRTRLES